MFLRAFRLAQLWLAAAVLAATWMLGGQAFAQTFSVTNANIGNIGAAASGASTSFTFAASNGAVSISGSASRGAGAPLTVRAAVAITCSVNYCKTKSMRIRVTNFGSGTGKFGTLTNFTMALGTAPAGVTLSSVTSLGANTYEATLSTLGQNNTATIYIGATLPVTGDGGTGSVGPATSGFLLLTADPNGNSGSSTSGVVSGNVFRSISLAKNADLSFGRVIRPLSGPGSVTLSAADGSRSTTGALVWTTTPFSTRARYTVTGEGGQVLSISIPTTFTMTNAASDSITVTTNNNLDPTPTLSSSLGSSGTYQFYVGGSMPISDTTPSGSYTGNFTVTASYN